MDNTITEVNLGALDYGQFEPSFKELYDNIEDAILHNTPAQHSFERPDFDLMAKKYNFPNNDQNFQHWLTCFDLYATHKRHNNDHHLYNLDISGRKYKKPIGIYFDI